MFSTSIKKKICALLSAVMMTSFISAVNASAAVATDNENISVASVSYQTLPNIVDLSTSPCFPPIVSQGSILNACVAYSTTYYQYSYQMNKYKNVTSVEDRKIYSPNWVYSLANQGLNEAIEYEGRYGAYNVLANLGCVTIDTQPLSNNYQIWTAHAEEEKIEALKTRLTSHGELNIPVNQNISSPSNLISNNFPLSDVKAKLNDGYVLVVGSKGYFNSANVDGQCVAYRCYEGETDYAHSLTIVGYNNYLEYDVNGDGTIQSCEKGAFKVANSWGTSFSQNGIFSNDGYFWIMYDALNLTSTNTYNSWESSYNTVRYPAFCTNPSVKPNNIFRYIEVGDKDIKLIGELRIRTNNKYAVDIRKRINQSPNASLYGAPSVDPYFGENPRVSPFDGILLFDLTNLTEGVPNYYNGYYYHIILSNFDPASGSNYARFRLLDNMGNVVKDYEEDNSDQANAVKKYKLLDFELGDVNYDGSLTSDDAALILNSIIFNATLSNFQKDLADCDQNGYIDSNDAYVLQTMIPQSAEAQIAGELIQAYNSGNIALLKEYCTY